MATSRLTDIVKARRESGEGVASSLAGGFKERLKEKFDPRNVFNQDGLLTSLFPKLKAYKSKDVDPKKDEVPAGTKPGLAAGDSVDSLKPLFLSIEKSTKTIAKNNISLNLIQRDTNLMKQTLSKIVKIISGRKTGTKKETKRTEPTKVTEIPQVEEEEDKGGILGAILGAILVIKGLINSVVDFIKNIIATFVKRFLPVLRTIAQLGTRFLPMLASVPVLVAALAALAAYSVFKLGLDYRQGKETQADLILLRQKKKDKTATPEELKRLDELEKKGVTASQGEARQMAAVQGAANTGLPILKQLEDEIKSGKTTESDANDLILESTGFDLAMLREFKKARDADPKINNDLVTFAAKKGVQSTKLKNVYIRPQTLEAMDAVYRNRSVGFGDELTAQLVGENKIGEGGVEASAQSPTDVLRLIENYKKENDDNPTILEGKTIFLSTGFENSNGSTKEFDTVLKQISTLKSMGASDNAIKILGVSEQAKNATEINDGLKKIALKNENEYLPVVNKKNLGKTFVSKAMSGKATLPAAAADADDQRLGETIANSLNPASTTPTAAPSASDTGGASELGGSATSPTPAIPMSEQDTYTSNNTDTADSNIKPESSSTQSSLTSSGDDPIATTLSQESPKDKAKDLTPVSGGDIGSFQAADAASTTDADNTGEFQAEPIKENKLPIDDPYNDQHPQFSSLIKRLANEYGVPA
tara:strand:- start:5561 stop:7675 length:2115 start_codon:yes stop_codon:yes gene_type:complete